MPEKEIVIKGVIAFDVERKEHTFITYLEESDFEKGVYKTEYSYYVYIRDHEIRVAQPDDFDPIKPQMDHLDEQEKQLGIKYQQALRHIQVQRNNLLAIENAQK